MNGVVRNGLVCLCGAALFGVLWVGAEGRPIADGFRLAALWLALASLVVLAWGLLRD
jgi:hypothetical protein